MEIVFEELDFYFEEIEIKGRSSMGNQVTKYPIKTVKFKEAGKSTLAGRKLWFDDKFGRLNTEEKGKYLGSFEDEKLIVITKEGTYELTDTELAQLARAAEHVATGVPCGIMDQTIHWALLQPLVRNTTSRHMHSRD